MDAIMGKILTNIEELVANVSRLADAVEKATACTVTAVHIIVQQLVFEEDRHDG
mgnify:CR=1 FL=1